MNTPITTHSKALAAEGRLAAEELANAKNAIIAELAHVTAENMRLKAELDKAYIELERLQGLGMDAMQELITLRAAHRNA